MQLHTPVCDFFCCDLPIVLAGMGSIFGAFAAGLLLGAAEAISNFLFGATYREVVGLALFLLVLLVRPQGLFARRQR